MPQQINLFNPILLTPRRVFSARTMLQGLGLFAAALVAVSAWSAWRTQALARELAATAPMLAAQKQQLSAALAQLPAAGGDVQALAQELAAAQQRLSERRLLAQELGGSPSAASPVALLRGLAQTLPAPVWLTEVKLDGRRLELAGLTLQPEALQPWLAHWQPPGVAAGAAPALVRVERERSGGGGSPGREAWAFRLVHGGPGSPGGAAR